MKDIQFLTPHVDLNEWQMAVKTQSGVYGFIESLKSGMNTIRPDQRRLTYYPESINTLANLEEL